MVGRGKDPVSDLLRSTMRLMLRVKLLQERYARLYSAATSTTPHYSAEPGTPKVDQRKDALWLQVGTAEEELAQVAQDYWRHEEKVHALLSKLHEPAHVAILQLRYCDGLKWPEVQEKLDLMGLYYSERHMFNLHGDALQEARRIYREQEAQVDEDSDRTNTDK